MSELQTCCSLIATGGDGISSSGVEVVVENVVGMGSLCGLGLVHADAEADGQDDREDNEERVDNDHEQNDDSFSCLGDDGDLNLHGGGRGIDGVGGVHEVGGGDGELRLAASQVD